MGEGRLTGGAGAGPAPAEAPPLRLAICITTFGREAEVAVTAARVTAFLDGEGAPLLAGAGVSAHLFVVDNGQSVALPPHSALTVIPNANLGGAGAGSPRPRRGAGRRLHALPVHGDDASFPDGKPGAHRSLPPPRAQPARGALGGDDLHRAALDDVGKRRGLRPALPAAACGAQTCATPTP